jgi:uncharacterized protein YlxW (UPF0749 family)
VRDDPAGSAWGTALRRVGVALWPRWRRVGRSGWTLGVPVVIALAGLLFTTSARTANGTSIRDDRPQLSNLILDRNRQVAQSEAQLAALRGQVDALTNTAAGSNGEVAAQQQRATDHLAAAGLTPVHGPGLTVRLNDAPHNQNGILPPGATSVDDLVVHQQDVQAVVNALWAGGAEAMTIMGVRVISTSAVRCVGNTLLLNGRVYSPPFEITAIGDQSGMHAALDAAPGVTLFREAASAFGLGYDVNAQPDVSMPGYDGAIGLQYAHAAG